MGPDHATTLMNWWASVQSQLNANHAMLTPISTGVATNAAALETVNTATIPKLTTDLTGQITAASQSATAATNTVASNLNTVQANLTVSIGDTNDTVDANAAAAQDIGNIVVPAAAVTGSQVRTVANDIGTNTFDYFNPADPVSELIAVQAVVATTTAIAASSNLALPGLAAVNIPVGTYQVTLVMGGQAVIVSGTGFATLTVKLATGSNIITSPPTGGSAGAFSIHAVGGLIVTKAGNLLVSISVPAAFSLSVSGAFCTIILKKQ